MGRKGRAELALCYILAPVSQTDLMCPPADVFLAGDASEYAAGLAVAPIDERTAREMYRHRERRGWWAPLHTKVRSYLVSIGVLPGEEVGGPVRFREEKGDPEKIVVAPTMLDNQTGGEGKPFWGERYWFGELM